MLFIISTLREIRHPWQPQMVTFLHRGLLRALLLKNMLKTYPILIWWPGWCGNGWCVLGLTKETNVLYLIKEKELYKAATINIDKPQLLIKAHLHWWSFLPKMSAIPWRYSTSLLALVVLGNVTRKEMILFVSRHPRWPRQFERWNCCMESQMFLAKSFANVNTT